jgi:hypothetical protein
MANQPHAMADPPSTTADPPSDLIKQKFTGKRKKSGIAYHRKKCQTFSAEKAVANHAAPDANNEVVAAAVSVIILQHDCVLTLAKYLCMCRLVF